MTVKWIAAAVLSASLLAGAEASAKDADPVAATVDGHVIRLSDVENARGLLPPQLQGEPLEAVYPMLLDSLINTRLAAEKARGMGLHETSQYKDRMARIGEQILERMLLGQHISEQLSEESIQKRYDDLRARAANVSEVQARHILLQTEDAARLMVEKLKGGEDFASLAKEHSIGPSAPKGGDLGWFGPGRMVREFEDAAMMLEPGAFTEAPVRTQYGWHVIKVEARRPLSVPSFEELRAALANELSAEAGQTLMKRLRDDAKVEKVDWQELD